MADVEQVRAFRRWLKRACIPLRSVERITRTHPDGTKAVSEFWQHDGCVGRARWDESGRLVILVGMRDGRIFGRQLSFSFLDGQLEYEEPLREGVVHGWAKQYGRRGRLIMACLFKHGTGTDYWCDDAGKLSEEHPSVAGLPSGCERWWAGPDAIFSETWWVAGKKHGVAREWRDDQLRQGEPRFFVHNQAVSKSRYLKVAKTDPTLVPYRPEDDDPTRTLPPEFLRLRRMARRKKR